MEQTPTPITDREEFPIKPNDYFIFNGWYVESGVARRLERERAMLREALQAIVDYVGVNELDEAPRVPLAPGKMKAIARAALEATK